MRISSLRLDINIEFLCLESRDARALLDNGRCAGPHYRRETIFTVGTWENLWTTQKLHQNAISERFQFGTLKELRRTSPAQLENQ